MKTFWAVLGRQKAEFIWLLVVGSLLGGIEALLHPLMLKWLFDEAVIARDFRRFLLLSLGYFALAMGILGLAYATSLWQKAFANRVILDLELRLLEQSLRLDWRAFNRQGSGALVSRIHKDTSEGFVPALNLALAVVQQALAASVFVAVLLYLSWKATLALLLMVPPPVWFAHRMGRRVRQITSEEREARFLHILTESLKAFRILSAVSHLRPPTLAANRRALGSYLDGSYENLRLISLQQTWSDVFRNLADTLSLVVGGYYVLVRELTFGGYLAFVNAFWRAVGNTVSLLQRVPEFQRYSEILKRIEELLSLAPTPYARVSPVARLQGVRLSYDGRSVLDIAQLEIYPGERVLVVGPNGSGKTTLLHILAGYMAPDQGEVVLPQRVAALTAPVELPPLTVKEMVANPSCLEALGLQEVSDHVPDALSAGQKQKVAIGALLSQEADLYILDEPLANLDAQSKEKVMELIFRKTLGKALVVVLHGDEALHERFDKVVTLAGCQPARVMANVGSLLERPHEDPQSSSTTVLR